MTVAATEQRPGARTRESNRLIRIGGGLIAALIVIAVAAPLLAPHDPEAVEVSRVLGAPDLAHPFGSDVLGRDVLSRVIFGLRASLAVSIAAVLGSFVVAVPLGLAAGYFGRWTDSAISRLLDLILVFPAMLLAVAFIAVLGPGSSIAALAMVMRTSTLIVSRNDYVSGARARGASHWRAIVQHVAPNALGPAVVQASVLAAFALQLEAGLSFLGLGTQPPTPSLGGMLADGREVLVQAPWVEIFPGLAIVIAVLGFTFLGEGLRRALDPRGVAE